MRRIAWSPIVAALLLPAAQLLPAQSRWRVDSAPMLDIRGTSPTGELVFGVATMATRLPNGTIALADGASATIRFFSASGQPVRSVGRPGAGPGEFRSITSISQCGADSVYVWDTRQRRMSVFSAAGQYVRQFSIPSDAATPAAPFLVGCSARRSFAYTTISRDPGPEPGIFRGMTPVVVTDADGKITREAATVASTEFAAVGGAGFPRPLGRSTSFAFAGDRLYIGTADSATIEAYLPDGSRRTIRLDIPRRAATRQHFDHAIELIANLAPAAARERALAAMREVAIPQYLPPYNGLFGDPDGNAWVLLSAPGDPETRLRAVGPDDRVVADIRIPGALTVFEVGRDYILGATEDPQGEPHLVMYRLRRS
jgi:hypothetical protein